MILKVVPQAVVILRFLGTTQSSSNIRGTLQSICQQIQINYLDKKDRSLVPDDWRKLIDQFQECLSLATETKPLLIFLDSLDQLSPQDSAHSLNWVPKVLPPWCTLVVSTLPDMFHILSTIKNRLVKDQANLVSVSNLGEELGLGILSEWLQAGGRKLTDAQKDIVHTALTHCSLPLYIKLVYDDVIHWRSYDPVSKTTLLHTVTAMINNTFGRLEKKHGQMFTSRALTYITASRNGLGEIEMEDLLSLDDDVLTDVFQYHIPPVRRIPPILWVRLRQELAGYLVTREADGVGVNYWYHRQFIQAAQNRFLGLPEINKKIHHLLADFFSGTWHGKPKPFKYTTFQMKKLKLSSSEGEADRKVSSQPDKYEIQNSRGTTSESNDDFIRYNIRKFNNLPYHLYHSGRQDELKKRYICDYRWLYTKLKATSVHAILEDVNLIGDDEMTTLGAVFKPTISSTPETLALEITGSLAPFYTETSPCLKQLIDTCFNESYKTNALLPRMHLYTSPGGRLKYTFEDKKQRRGEKVLFLSADGNTVMAVSGEKELLLWDLVRGQMEKTLSVFPEDYPAVNAICRAPDGIHVVLASTSQYAKAGGLNPVAVVNIQEKEITQTVHLEKIYSIRAGCLDQYKVILARNKLIAVVQDESVDIFHLDTGKLDMGLDIPPSVVYVNRSMDLCIVGHCKEKEIWIWDLRSMCKAAVVSLTYIAHFIYESVDGSVVYVGHQHKPCVSVLHIQGSQGKIIADRSEISFAKHIRSGQAISGIGLSQNGKYLLLALNHDILVWNVAEETLHRYLRIGDVRGYGVVHDIYTHSVGFTPDSRYIMAGYQKDVFLWDCQSGKLFTALTVDPDITREVFAVLYSAANQYVITSAKWSTFVKVWDLLGQDNSQVIPLQFHLPCHYMTAALDHPIAVISYGVLEFSDECYSVNLETRRTLHRLARGSWVLDPVISRSGRYALLKTLRANEIDVTPRVEIWNTKTGTRIRKFSNRYWKNLILSPDETLLVTHCEPGSDTEVEVQVWDLHNNTTPSRKLDLTEGGYRHMVVSGDNSLLVLLLKKPLNERGCCIIVYSLVLDRVVKRYHNVLSESMHQLPNLTDIVFTVCGDRPADDVLTIVTLDRDGGQIIREGSIPGCKELHFSQDGSRAVDTGYRVLDLNAMEVLCSFSSYGHGYFWRKITPDGRYVVWMADKMVKVGRVEDGQVIGQCYLHCRPLAMAVFANRGVAVATDNGTVMLLHIVDSHDDDVTVQVQLAYSSYQRHAGTAVKRQNQTKSKLCSVL